MSTSGTVGLTQFSFAKVLDLALRRCGLNPAIQTPELVTAAREALFIDLVSLANRGPNLWRIEHGFLGLTPGKVLYQLPAGTMRIKDINFVTNQVVDGTLSSVAGGYDFAFTDNVSSRFGFKPSADFTAALTIDTDDGTGYVNQLVIVSSTYQSGEWYWFDLPVSQSITNLRITSVTAFTLDELAVSSQFFTIPLWQWSRTEYSFQPNRTQPGRPSTNYYFDRQNPSQIWIWPAPTNELDHLEYWVHRQIQDIDLLTEEVDLPTHWVSCATWLMAKELCFIVPGVDPAKVQMVFAEYDRILNEAEMGESDGSSTYIQPRVGVYTR